MVELLRGGESVGQSTLTRFYSLHTFVLPWSLAVFMLMHFLMIRKQGYFRSVINLIILKTELSELFYMSTLKKPDLSDPKLRAKLAKGMGHNYYGEPAWPNDLLYIFPVVILGTIACVVGLAVLDPAMLGDKANPFATPLEILPEWYLYPVFQILRVVPNKLLGIALQTLIPLGLMILPFIENVNKFSNPFRRPVAMSVFLFGTFLTIYLGIGACLPIDKSLTLGLF